MMNRAKQIVRINFWSNNVLILCGFFMCISFLGIFSFPKYAFPIAVIFFISISSTLRRRSQKKMGIKTNHFFFFDDERDQTIGYKVNAGLLSYLFSSVYILTLALIFIPLFTNDINTAILIILFALVVIFLGMNILYYRLWIKYDQD